MHFIVIERHPQAAAFGQEFTQQHEPRPHHAQPLVVAQQVLAVHRIAGQPFLHDRGIDIVVVTPLFISGVVRRVNEDQINLSRVARQQALQRMQVVAVNDEIAAEIAGADRLPRVRR